MKWITIFADASYCNKTKAAGIAVWGRNATEFLRFSQAISFPVYSNTEAETIAMCTGVIMALETLSPDGGDRLSIQSDCIHAINALRDNKGSTEVEKHFCTKAANAMRDYNVTPTFKHVKGHSGAGNPRSAVNDFCDRNARMRLQEARTSLVKRVNEAK